MQDGMLTLASSALEVIVRLRLTLYGICNDEATVMTPRYVDLRRGILPTQPFRPLAYGIRFM